MEIEAENRSLFSKMQAVTKRKGELNPLHLKKHSFHQKGSLNLDTRLKLHRNIISENELLD